MSNKPNAESRIEGFKTRNGCNTIADKPRQTTGGIHFHNCYCNHRDYGFNATMGMFNTYEKGFLPYPGSVLEQPNKAMEVINLISHLKSELEEKQNNKGKK